MDDKIDHQKFQAEGARADAITEAKSPDSLNF